MLELVFTGATVAVVVVTSMFVFVTAGLFGAFK